MSTNEIEPYLSDAFAERDIAMWRMHCAGHPQEAIARRLNVSQSTVSRAIIRVRKAIPREARADAIQRELSLLYEMRAALVDRLNAGSPPAFSQRGDALVDPRNGQIVEDPTEYYAAFSGIMKTMDHVMKMLGLNAPVRAEVAVEQVTYVLVGVDDEALR